MIIIQAFAAYDNEGKIDVKMFQHALMTWGDKMTKAEIDDIFDEFEVDEDYMVKTKEVLGLFVAVKEEEKKVEEAEVDCDPHDHGSCSPTKFDSGQGSEGSTGSHHSSQDHGDPDSPGRTSSSSSQISSAPSPDASLARQDNLLDTSDESSLDSLELDQMRYILKPKLHKYSHIHKNNNNNSHTSNKNSKTATVGTKCHITITSENRPKSNSNSSNNSSSHSSSSSSSNNISTTSSSPGTTTSTSPDTTSSSQQQEGSTRPVLMIDPRCQEIVSGHVTMVTVEGGAVAGQIERLQSEVTRLKVEKQ